MKLSLLYLSILLLFVGGIGFAIQQGQSLNSLHSAGVIQSSPAHAARPVNLGGGFHPLVLLLGQLAIILVATRAMGWLFARFKQPAVVGEMVAGIMLGPSLFGWLFPAAFSAVFAPASLGGLGLLSQIGVCLFLFAVGLELDVDALRHRVPTALVVSHSSIVVPFSLGVLLALWVFVPLAPAGVAFIPFALFVGISLSATAFPVLARILSDRGMNRTELGHTALTSAAIGDVTVWIGLALLVAMTRPSGGISGSVTLVGTLIFLALMLVVVRPALKRGFEWGQTKIATSQVHSAFLLLAIVVLLASAWTTEKIGIHSLFGAFLAGFIMPPDIRLRSSLKERLERWGALWLLPIFFALTGLRTQIGALHGVQGWGLCLIIVALATLGKLGGSCVTARLAGMSWLESFRLGALMNTRGLMELIVLNVGYEMGILSLPLFTMLVIMALTTTLMTGPLLNLADGWQKKALSPQSTPQLGDVA